MPRGRPKKKPADTLCIDYTKVSKHTWAFRLRWRRENGSRGVAVLKRVTDQEFKRIKSSRVEFAAFKRKLIEDYNASLAEA